MDSGFETKILICADCEEEFVFTVAAQEYFAEKGYTEDPKLCKSCYMNRKRDKRVAHQDRGGGGSFSNYSAQQNGYDHHGP